MDLKKIVEAIGRGQTVARKTRLFDSLMAYNFECDNLVFLGMYDQLSLFDEEIKQMGSGSRYSLEKSVPDNSSFNFRSFDSFGKKGLNVFYTGYTKDEDTNVFLLSLAHIVSYNKVCPENFALLEKGLESVFESRGIRLPEIHSLVGKIPLPVQGALAHDFLNHKIKTYALTSLLLPKPLREYSCVCVNPIKPKDDAVFNYLASRLQ